MRIYNRMKTIQSLLLPRSPKEGDIIVPMITGF